jgi:hypothetical protein
VRSLVLERREEGGELRSLNKERRGERGDSVVLAHQCLLLVGVKRIVRLPYGYHGDVHAFVQDYW